MFKILTLNTISPKGLEQFPRDRYEVGSDVTSPDGILVRSQDMHAMAIDASVKVIGRAGAGVNTIPVDSLTRRGIPVLNTPGANANAVRELVIAGMLLASRNIVQAWNYVSHLETSRSEIDEQIEKDKKQFVGFELLGKTLGVVGLGSVGVKVANAAMALGMRVVGYDPTITVDRAWELSSDVQQMKTLDDLLQVSDFVTFHVPLNDDTKNLLNANRLQQLKKGAVVLNFAREGIVELSALSAALQEGRVHAYVTDFPSVELKDHSRVICLPHLGASTQEAEENCAVMIVRQVREFLEQGTISYSVNFPSIAMPVNQQASRLVVVNANVPNMVAQISGKLAQANLNILSLLNKSRDEIACTLIDVNSRIESGLLKEIATIQGVIQVRKIESV